jgi:hypothetical protein
MGSAFFFRTPAAFRVTLSVKTPCLDKERKDTLMEQDQATLSLPAPAQILRAKTLQATNRAAAINVSILEDLANDHDFAMAKLRDALPPEFKPYVALADHFDEVKFGTLRNRMLRACNDARREIEEATKALRLEGSQ